MEMEATFTIEGAILRDSGHYSCVVLPSKCIQEHQKILDGNNSVFVEVRGEGILTTAPTKWHLEKKVFKKL